MRIKTIIILLLLTIIHPLVAADRQNKISFFLNGDISFIKEHGSTSNYILGINSFPVYPGHSEFGVGCSINYMFLRKIILEIGVNFNRGKTITLVDPRDNDELRYETPHSNRIYLSLNYDFNNAKIVPYISIGGGVSNKQGKAGYATTKYGYSVILVDRSRDYSLIVLAGTGVKVFVLNKIALRIEGKYVYFNEDRNGLLQINCGIQF